VVVEMTFDEVPVGKAPDIVSKQAWAQETSEMDQRAIDNNQVGRCRLTVSKPVLKAPMVSAQRLKLISTFAFDFNLRRYNQRIKTYNNAPSDFPTFVREGRGLTLAHFSAQLQRL